MPAVINSGAGSGELNPGFGGDGPVATAIGVVRQPQLIFSAGTNVLSAQVTYGFDQVAGEARVVCVTPTGSIGDSVTITMGATHIAQRFRGTIVSIDTTLAPHSVTMLCKGPLYALEIYKNDVETLDGLSPRPGLSFADLTGSFTGTLRQTVTAVLDRLGVTYSLGHLQDPSHVYGVGGATDEMTWGTHETAAAYIHRFLEASAGYRLFDSADGQVYLTQISAVPSGTDISPFTVGVDIFGNTQHTTTSLGRQAAVIVHGYDLLGLGPATSGVVGSGQSAYQINNTLIESDAFATEIANFWLPQVSRLQETVRLSTPRDDLIGPAQSHAIDGLSADNLWVKSVTTEITSNGDFTQHMIYVSGV